MISDQIEFYRKSLGLTQKQLALKLHITQECLSLYEKGKRQPNIEMIKSMCDIFDCTTDELLEYRPISERKKVTISHSFNHSKNINVKL